MYPILSLMEAFFSGEDFQEAGLSRPPQGQAEPYLVLK